MSRLGDPVGRQNFPGHVEGTYGWGIRLGRRFKIRDQPLEEQLIPSNVAFAELGEAS